MAQDDTSARKEPGHSTLSRAGQLSIGAFLALLMAAIIVPSLVFGVVLLQRNNSAQQDMVTTLAEATASTIAEAVDRQLSGMLTALRVLSTSRSVEAGDLADFYRRASRALEDSGSYLIVTDDDFNQLLNTRVPAGTPLGRLSDLETAQRAKESGKLEISNAFFGETAQRWVFNAVLPLPVPEGRIRMLILTQDAERLSESISSHNLRGGWNAVLVDRNGLVLASSFMSSDIGKPFFLGGVDGPTSSTIRRTVSVEGQTYETIRAVSPLTGWQAIVWAPTSIVQAPMTRSLRVLAIGGLAIITIGALLAWILGRQISNPIRSLARDARRLGAGESVEPVEYPVAEITTVSLALAHASQERRQAENEIRFLMREVAHRSKNQLTVVSSIAKQTARHAKNFATFQDAFQKRVQGLARSTDLLIAGGVAGVELKELLEAQIEPFRPNDPQRLELVGPRFRLSNQAAQTIGLAVHELATNAAKYGAFSGNEGRLSVTWKRSGDALNLVWKEHVPRLRKRAETRGFGTEVIERMLGGTLDAQIERTIQPNGLECRFVMPLANLEAGAEDD